MLDNTPEYWDPVWQSDKPSVHVLVTLNAQAGPCGAVAITGLNVVVDVPAFVLLTRYSFATVPVQFEDVQSDHANHALP